MIEQIIKGFKEDRISYSEFLVYFDIKEAKKKTDDTIQKSQQKWVRHYSNVLNTNKLDPMDILKEADKNKDGIIELKEIQDVLKQYVKVDQISFTDLQHIMDAFDANNDGRVSTQEYKDAILKYGVKIKSPEELKLEQQGFVSKVAQACKDNGTTLKASFAKTPFNENGNLPLPTVMKRLKSDTSLDNNQLNQLLNCIISPDATEITAQNLFKFYDNFLLDDSNIDLEFKYMLFNKEKLAKTIFDYLDKYLEMNITEKPLDLNSFADSLKITLQIEKSSSGHIYAKMKKVRPEAKTPGSLDFYALLLNYRDSEQVGSQLSAPKEIAKKIYSAIEARYPKNKNEALNKFGTDFEVSLNENGSSQWFDPASFVRLFVDMNKFITANEALVCFKDIKPLQKIPGPVDTVVSASTIGQYLRNTVQVEKPKKSEPSPIPKSPEEKPKSPISKHEPEPKPKVEKPESVSLIHKIEKSAGQYLPIIYTRTAKSAIIKETNLSRYLSAFFKEPKVTLAELDEMKELIMGDNLQLNFKQLYSSIEQYTSYKPKLSPEENSRQLKGLIKEAIKTDPEFDTNKDKGFINAILSLPNDTNDHYRKYELLDVYYSDYNSYKEYSKEIIENKQKGKDVMPVPAAPAKPEPVPKPEEEKEKKLPSGGLFGKLGLKEKEPVKEDAKLTDRAGEILDQIKEGIAADFTAFRDKDQSLDKSDPNKSYQIDVEEQKQFNRIISNFIKDYEKITNMDNIMANIATVTKFFTTKEGSMKFQTLRDEIKLGTEQAGFSDHIDILDFWKRIDKWNEKDFKVPELEKYVWCFLKFLPETCQVNIKELEHYYIKVTDKNKKAKGEHMKMLLKDVYNKLVGMTKSANPDKSVEIEYNVVIKGGKKLHKGSVEELIFDITKFCSNEADKKKLFEAFSKRMDSENEFDQKGLKGALEEVGIANSKIQREALFKIMDTNNDVMISKHELEKFIENYDSKKSVGANLLIKGSESKGVSSVLSNLFQKNMQLKPKDFFVPEGTERDKKMTTILNSDTACITKIEEIIQEMKRNNQEHFVDLDFGPRDAKDAEGSKLSLYANGSAPPGYVKPEQIEWISAKKYTNGEGAFITTSTSSNDVIQGALGDCWFIGALSVLAIRDELIIGGLNYFKESTDIKLTPAILKQMAEGVYPPIFRMYEKYGIYVFRFFKNFEWRYVIIDDRIPCYKANKLPVFARCSDINELWVPLIEKAYAKIHCCYEALISGFIDDGLTDLTGFVAEKINMHDKNELFPNKKLGTPEQFWNYLKDRIGEESMLGCARKDEAVEGQVLIDGEPTGILSRHAYGILDVFELPLKGHNDPEKLLRVRNPWGKTEWIGDWSDHSDELQTYKEEINNYIKSLPEDEQFEAQAEDGTFLINYKDWSTIYNKLYVTIDFPTEWSGRRFHDRWDSSNAGGLPMPSKGVTAKEASKLWAKNPQYLIKHEMDQEVEFFFSLAQQDGRVVRGSKFPFPDQIHPVCMILYPSKNGERALEFDQKIVKPEWISAVVEHKEISLRAKLPKGTYLLVPSTKDPNLEGEYYLNIYFSADILDVQIINLTNPKVKGIEIKEEDEDVDMDELRKIAIEARMVDYFEYLKVTHQKHAMTTLLGQVK